MNVEGAWLNHSKFRRDGKAHFMRLILTCKRTTYTSLAQSRFRHLGIYRQQAQVLYSLFRKYSQCCQHIPDFPGAAMEAEHERFELYSYSTCPRSSCKCAQEACASFCKWLTYCVQGASYIYQECGLHQPVHLHALETRQAPHADVLRARP